MNETSPNDEREVIRVRGHHIPFFFPPVIPCFREDIVNQLVDGGYVASGDDPFVDFSFNLWRRARDPANRFTFVVDEPDTLCDNCPVERVRRGLDMSVSEQNIKLDAVPEGVKLKVEQGCTGGEWRYGQDICLIQCYGLQIGRVYSAKETAKIFGIKLRS